MVKIEISVLETECSHRRRIPNINTLQHELTAWKNKPNDKQARINWRFTKEKAKEKFKLIKNKM